MYNYKYLSAQHLEGFDHYKYMAVDTNPLSKYLMHPFWNHVVKIVPIWVAPNLLTFVGFLFTVLDFLILSAYDYYYYAASTPDSSQTPSMANGARTVIPGWCWIALAIFLFISYTLDGIDGKQARRTQTSGPLGELFDHGLDSYSVFFIPVCLYSVFGRLDYSVPPIRMYFVLWNICINFYISHWEKYNTGVLYLPWSYDFSMWGAIIVFIVTGINGTSFWKIHVINNFSAANLFEWSIYGLGLMTNLPVSAYNTYVSYKRRTGKMRGLVEAIRPLWALAAVFAATTLWVIYSPSDIVNQDPRIVYVLVGTVFSNLTCRLIVCQMSGQRCPATCWLLWPVCAAAAVSLSLPSQELRALYLVTALAVCAHIHYGTCVVRQMCDHFRSGCFHIRQRSD